MVKRFLIDWLSRKTTKTALAFILIQAIAVAQGTITIKSFLDIVVAFAVNTVVLYLASNYHESATGYDPRTVNIDTGKDVK